MLLLRGCKKDLEEVKPGSVFKTIISLSGPPENFLWAKVLLFDLAPSRVYPQD